MKNFKHVEKLKKFYSIQYFGFQIKIYLPIIICKDNFWMENLLLEVFMTM